MMTFKEFYLQSSKGDKAPPRASWTFKTPKRQNEILDRISEAEGSQVSVSPHVRNYPLTGHMADVAESTRLTHSGPP